MVWREGIFKQTIGSESLH